MLTLARNISPRRHFVSLISLALPEPLMPPAQLASLPHELKVKIADECHAADERIDEIFLEIQRRGGLQYGPSTGAQQQATLAERRKSYPRAVGALYATSREWQAVTSPFRFEHLTSTQVAKPIFSLVTAPTRGYLVRSLALSTAVTPEHFAVLAAVLPLLPNLRAVDLAGYANLLRRVRRQAVASVLDATVATFTRLCCRIESLTLPPLLLCDATRLLSAPTQLQTLTFAFNTNATGHELCTILSFLPSLTALHLDCAACAEPGPPTCLAVIAGAPPNGLPELKVVTIRARVCPSGLPGFFGLFERSLERIRLEASLFIGGGGSSAGEILTSRNGLPRLRDLELAGQYTGVGQILRRLDPALLPGLRRLGVFPNILRVPAMIFEAVEALVRVLSPLRRIDMYPLSHMSLAHTQETKAFEEAGIDLHQRPDHLPCLALLDNVSTWHALRDLSEDAMLAETGDGLLGIIDANLSFASKLRDSAAACSDTASFARLAELLRPFDLERILHEA